MTPKTKPYLPHQLFHWENDIYGNKVECGEIGPEYHTPLKFGQFVLVKRGPIDDKSAARYCVAIVLGMEPDTRALLVRFPDNTDLLVRHKCRPITDEQGRALWAQSTNKKDFVGADSAKPIDPEQDVQLGTYDCEDVEQHDEVKFNVDDTLDIEGEEELPQLPIQPPAQPPVQRPSQPVQPTSETTSTTTTRQSTRQRKSTQQSGFIYDDPRISAMLMGSKEVGLNEPIFVALERLCAMAEEESKFAEQAKVPGKHGRDASIKLEILRLWKKYGAFQPVKLTKEERAQIKTLRARLFSTVKEVGGQFERNKSRMVARGDLRSDKPTEFSETFSPTFAYQSFLIILNLILARDMSWRVIDIENAYLNAKLHGEIYMRLDKEVVRHMVELDPSIAKYVEEDGTIIVKLVKALYGLQESAKLWYDTISAKLKELGFSVCAYDRSLFYKQVNGELVTVLLYVDDILLAGSEQEMDKVETELSKCYVVKSKKRPYKFDYVGTSVQYIDKDGSFVLSQRTFLEKVVAEQKETAEVPSGKDLFDQSIGPEIFEDPSLYRSKVMEMVYASRTRLDFKPTLSYLVTKCQTPTMGDWGKLQQLLNYGKGSLDIVLRVKPIKGGVRVTASSDASFANHVDYKSNTGLFIGIGDNVIAAKSSKQKVTATSSTAAEMMALSSAMEELLWVNNVLTELGFPQETVEVEQDNLSAIRLVEKGPSGEGRTKWFNVRYFWVKELLDDGTISLRYVPSKDMKADGFTKPLPLGEFKRWRARVQNLEDSC